MVTCFAPLGWSQAVTPAPAVKPRGPEAVAAQDPTRVVATVNGKKITAQQVVDMLKPFPPDQRKQIDANLTKAIEQIYTQRQLAEEARVLNLDKKSPWKEQLELSQQNVLARAYIGHMADAEDAQKYYDLHKAEYDSAKLSGIFVGFNPPGTPATGGAPNARTEEQAREKANDLEKKIAAGGDFAALARAESEHQTASKGGDLGSVPINDPQVQIPAEIRAAVAKLQPGQVSEPVRIPGAYLIVKLDAREAVPFAKAKPGIEQKLQAEVLKKETEKYTIQIEDPDFFETGSGSTPKIPSLQRPAAAVQPKP